MTCAAYFRAWNEGMDGVSVKSVTAPDYSA